MSPIATAVAVKITIWSASVITKLQRFNRIQPIENPNNAKGAARFLRLVSGTKKKFLKKFFEKNFENLKTIITCCFVQNDIEYVG